MLEESTPQLMHIAIELGKNGNVGMLRFLISQALKDRDPIPTGLPVPHTMNEVLGLLIKCAGLVINGENTMDIAKSITGIYGILLDMLIKYKASGLGGKKPR